MKLHLISIAALALATVLLNSCTSEGTQCCVMPDPPPAAVTNVSVSPSNASLSVGDSIALAVRVDVVSGAGTGVSWSSDNPSIATVSSSGVVVGVSPGAGVVRATSTFNPSVSGTAIVTVNAVQPLLVSISPRQVHLNPGVALALTATVTGGTGDNRSVTWSSSNSAVATIDQSGVVRGVAPGSSLVSARSAASAAALDTVTVLVSERLATAWTSSRIAGELYEDVVSVLPFSAAMAFAVNSKGDVVRWNGSVWQTAVRGSDFGTSYYAVHGSSPTNVIAVGAGGTAARWNGVEWSRINSGTGMALNNVWVDGDSSAWAAGAAGTVLHWDGSTWNVENTRSSATLYGIWAGDGVVYATGTAGEVLLRSSGSWTRVDVHVQEGLYAVHGFSANDVVIAGALGTVLHKRNDRWVNVSSTSLPGAYYSVAGLDTSSGRRYLAGDDGLVALDEHDRLSLVDTPFAPRLFGVGVDASGTIWTTGQRGIVMRSGLDWTTLNIAPDLLDVWTINPNAAWAVGEFGSIYRWNGSTWTRQTTPTTATLDAVWSTADRDAFAGGEGGVMLRWNGVTWAKMAFPSQATVYSIWGSSSDNVFAVTSAGEIAHWNGTSWQIEADVSASLWSVYGFSPDSVYASGEKGTVLKRIGSTWVSMPIAGAGTIAGLWTYGANGVYAVGANPGGNAGVAYSWNGTAWSAVDVGQSRVLTSLWGPGPFDIYATGDRGTVIRYDGNTVHTMTTGTDDLLWSISGSPDASGGAFAVGYNTTVVAGFHSGSLVTVGNAERSALRASDTLGSLDPLPGTTARRGALPDGDSRRRKHR